ncbi:MAG TPA: L-serine ammonia-lyase, iron-sulfur-dependent, subunit alpha [Firmicutes bacterium]|nr:L-serine ammonia-lyase, iron-sulfur-dependent, subunit alpha [Bacillota bacterium]
MVVREDVISVSRLAERAVASRSRISDIVLHDEALRSERRPDQLRSEMARNLEVMRQAVARGLEGAPRTVSGLVGGDARRIEEARRGGRLIGGEVLDLAIARAVAVAEVNASMGRVVAAPTAGSCGVLPGVLLTVAEKVYSEEGYTRARAGEGHAGEEGLEDALIAALFTAAGVGMAIAARASISGAEGGCQAEIGSAACMAAAAATELAGGTPNQVCHAGAIALKGLLGLVCDPVAGLVEVPCVKRNATAAAVAIAAVDMALAGVKSVIPIDEVIAAMGAVGRMLPCELRETAQGGLAATPTGRSIARRMGGASPGG